MLYEEPTDWRELDDSPLTDGDEFARLDAELPDGTHEKLGALVRWQANIKAQSDALKEEIGKLTAKKRAVDGRVDLFRRYMTHIMRSEGIAKCNAGIRTLFFRKNPPSVDVDTDQLGLWPERVLERARALGVVKERVDVDRKLLKTIPDWEHLPGVTIHEGEEALAIR